MAMNQQDVDINTHESETQHPAPKRFAFAAPNGMFRPAGSIPLNPQNSPVSVERRIEELVDYKQDQIPDLSGPIDPVVPRHEDPQSLSSPIEIYADGKIDAAQDKDFESAASYGSAVSTVLKPDNSSMPIAGQMPTDVDSNHDLIPKPFDSSDRVTSTPQKPQDSVISTGSHTELPSADVQHENTGSVGTFSSMKSAPSSIQSLPLSAENPSKGDGVDYDKAQHPSGRATLDSSSARLSLANGLSQLDHHPASCNDGAEMMTSIASPKKRARTASGTIQSLTPSQISRKQKARRLLVKKPLLIFLLGRKIGGPAYDSLNFTMG